MKKATLKISFKVFNVHFYYLKFFAIGIFFWSIHFFLQILHKVLMQTMDLFRNTGWNSRHSPKPTIFILWGKWWGVCHKVPERLPSNSSDWKK